MIGGSLLAVLPKGFFSWPNTVQDESRDKNMLSVDVNGDGEGKKRRRDDVEGDRVGGSRTPTLVSTARRFSCGDVHNTLDDGNERPLKRLRGRSKLLTVPNLVEAIPEKEKCHKQSSDFLSKVPDDVVAHCLSFLGTAEDRFALQSTCKLFRDISNSDVMLEKVNISGDVGTGKRGIIKESDTPSSAAATLAPFARAGNLEALYM